jgi:hypothetical protein
VQRVLYILCIVALISCPACHETARHATALPLENYSTIAIAKFVSPDPAIGQRVAERLAVKFSEAGYTVVRHEKLKKLSGKDVLTSPELTTVDKDVLHSNGVKGVVYGTIDRYGCRTEKKTTWTGFAPEQIKVESCSASLSVKLIDPSAGAVVWQTEESNSEKDQNATARMVMERVLIKIEDEIPPVKK